VFKEISVNITVKVCILLMQIVFKEISPNDKQEHGKKRRRKNIFTKAD
jgi:hypothetical protein